MNKQNKKPHTIRENAYDFVMQEIENNGYPINRGEIICDDAHSKPAEGLFMSMFKSKSGRTICRYELYNERLIGFFEVTNFEEAYRKQAGFIGLLLQNGEYLYYTQKQRDNCRDINTKGDP